MNEIKAKILCFSYKLLSRFNRQLATAIFYGGGYKSYGNKNEDSTVYVIRRNNKHVGLCSYMVTALGHLGYADSENMLPVIDMMYHENTYMSFSELGKKNAWEYFFEQPSKVTLKDAYKSSKVLLSSGMGLDYQPNVSVEFFNNTDGQMDYWKQIYKKYIKFSPEVQKLMDDEMHKILLNGERVLGVLCRGTDYLKLRPKNHPVQPEPSLVIEKVAEVFKEGNYNKIFLATEDRTIYEAFKERFGDIVVINDKHFHQYTGGLIGDVSDERENDKYYTGLEYLTTIYVLSKCTSIIAGRVNGTVIAALMNDSYEYSYYWDLGVY